MPKPKKYEFKTEEPYGWLSPELREALAIDRIIENNRREAERKAFMGNTKKPNVVQSAGKAVMNLPRNRDEIAENTMANLGVLSPANWIATGASALDARLGLIPGYQRDYDRIYWPTDKDNPRLHGLTGNPVVDEIAGLALDFTTPGVLEGMMSATPRVARGLNALERGISRIGRKPAAIPSQEFVTTATAEALPEFTYSYSNLPEDISKNHPTLNNYIIQPVRSSNKVDSDNLLSRLDINKDYFGLGTTLQSRSFNNFMGRRSPSELWMLSKANTDYADDAKIRHINNIAVRRGVPPLLPQNSSFYSTLDDMIGISASEGFPSIAGRKLTADDIGNRVAHEMAHKLMHLSPRYNKIDSWSAEKTARYLGIDPKQARAALGDRAYEYFFGNGGHEIRSRYSEIKNNEGVSEFTNVKHLRDAWKHETIYLPVG